MDLNELSKEVHLNALKKGFWHNEPSDSHCLMLTACEMAEGVEADRSPHKNIPMGLEQFASIYLPIYIQAGRPHAEIDIFTGWYNDNIKGGVPEELADAFIRLLDLAGARSIDIVIYSDCQDSFRAEIEKLSFCEASYRVCQIITSAFMPVGDIISISISMLYTLAEKCGFDLNVHVSLKMKYNANRAKMHGKLY